MDNTLILIQNCSYIFPPLRPVREDLPVVQWSADCQEEDPREEADSEPRVQRVFCLRLAAAGRGGIEEHQPGVPPARLGQGHQEWGEEKNDVEREAKKLAIIIEKINLMLDAIRMYNWWWEEKGSRGRKHIYKKRPKRPWYTDRQTASFFCIRTCAIFENIPRRCRQLNFILPLSMCMHTRSVTQSLTHFVRSLAFQNASSCWSNLR